MSLPPFFRDVLQPAAVSSARAQRPPTSGGAAASAGPHDDFDLENLHVIPGLIRKFDAVRAAGAPQVTLWGDGSATREFLFGEDAARGLAMAAARYDGVEPLNIGSAEELSIRDLAEMIRRKIGYTGDVIWDRSRPNGQPRRTLDVTSAAACFGFHAETPLDAGIDRTIAWWRARRGRG